MASDRLVTSQHVLKAMLERERRGATEILSELEKLEPDLMEYLLESLTRLHLQLADLGLPAREVRKLHRLAERTAVVCIMALRKAHHDLWRRDHGEGHDAAPDPQEPPESSPP